MKTAIYTGSFDPITLGHLNIIHRAANDFEQLIVAVGTNPTKSHLFTLEQRVRMIEMNISAKNVKVIAMTPGKLSVDLAYELRASIIKGVRFNSDFDYERIANDINHAHNANLNTLIYPCHPKMVHISSSVTKEICKLGGNTEEFVPLSVKDALEKVLNKQFRIGLTGTIGAGKSTIMQGLLDAQQDSDRAMGHGSVAQRLITPYHNIDMDILARNILFERDEPVYVELRESLKKKFELKVWDRKTLGDLVFRDKSARKILNQAIRQPMLTRIRSDIQGLTGVIVFNGALLIEAGFTHLCNNNVVLLDVNGLDQVKRLMARGYDETQIKRRISAQLNTKNKECILTEQIVKDGYGCCHSYNTSDLSAIEIVDGIRRIAQFQLDR